MKKILFVLAFAAALVSCEGEEEDTCVTFQNEGIEAVEPVATNDMAGYAYQLMFHCSNGCGDFDSVQETVDGNTRTIKVLAKYEGCICTQDIPERQGLYTFAPAQSGTYTLKFDKGDGTFLTETIVVE